jgi:mannose-6-phosphate isomerase-like protein (cupin superfamily)
MKRPISRVWLIASTATIMFSAGVGVGWSRRVGAEASQLAPLIIHVPQLTAADLPPAAKGMALQSKIVAATDGATVGVQLGTVGKHFHANANEIQYVIAGQGKFWLGDSFKDVGPGDLIIIPKGTPHGGTTTAFKALAIKSPPQAKEDLHPIP